MITGVISHMNTHQFDTTSLHLSETGHIHLSDELGELELDCSDLDKYLLVYRNRILALQKARENHQRSS